MTAVQGGHVVQCESVRDFNAACSLDGCQVQVGQAAQLVRVLKIDHRLTSADILDLVTEKLGDEEIVNDARRVALKQQSGPQSQPQAQRQPQFPRFRRAQVQAMAATELDEDEEDLIMEMWDRQVAAVDQRPEPPQQPAGKGSARVDPPAGGSKGGGKGNGKGGKAGPGPQQSQPGAPFQPNPRPPQQGGPTPAADSGKGGKGGGAQAPVAFPQQGPRPWCKQCGSGDHPTRMCPALDCWHCGEIGHSMFQCPHSQRIPRGKGGEAGRGPRPPPQ